MQTISDAQWWQSFYNIRITSGINADHFRCPKVLNASINTVILYLNCRSFTAIVRTLEWFVIGLTTAHQLWVIYETTAIISVRELVGQDVWFCLSYRP